MFNFLRALQWIPVNLWLHLGVTKSDKRDMIKHTLTSAHYVHCSEWMNACLLEHINHSEERKKFSSERLAYYIREFTRPVNELCVLQRMSILHMYNWNYLERERVGVWRKTNILNCWFRWKKSGVWKWTCQLKIIFKFVCFSTRIQWNGRKLHCVCHFNKNKATKNDENA